MPFAPPFGKASGDGEVIDAGAITLLGVDGERTTEAWITYEFRGTYATGGNVIDLSPWLRRAEIVTATPMSGSRYHIPLPNDSDFPGDPTSGRIKLLNSGLLEVANLTAVSGVRARVVALGY